MKYLTRIGRTLKAPFIGFWLMLNYLESIWSGDFDNKPDTFGLEL